MKIGGVDVEEFSRNLARLVEEGGRALAAYLKPREDGHKSNELAEEVGEVVKTLGQVAEYWLEDPQRARSGTALAGPISICGSRQSAATGEARLIVTPEAGDKALPIRNGRRISLYDFLKQCLSAVDAKPKPTGRRRCPIRSAYPAESRVLCPADAVSPELRADQSGIAARRSYMPTTWSAACACWRTRETGGGDLKIRLPDASMFAAGRLATTPGKVIFQNELMVIHTPYADVRAALIVPPWINKFAVLDLTPEKSFIRYHQASPCSAFPGSIPTPTSPGKASKTTSTKARSPPSTRSSSPSVKTRSTPSAAVGGIALAITAVSGAVGTTSGSLGDIVRPQVDFTHAAI